MPALARMHICRTLGLQPAPAFSDERPGGRHIKPETQSANEVRQRPSANELRSCVDVIRACAGFCAAALCQERVSKPQKQGGSHPTQRRNRDKRASNRTRVSTGNPPDVSWRLYTYTRPPRRVERIDFRTGDVVPGPHTARPGPPSNVAGWKSNATVNLVRSRRNSPSSRSLRAFSRTGVAREARHATWGRRGVRTKSTVRPRCTIVVRDGSRRPRNEPAHRRAE